MELIFKDSLMISGEKDTDQLKQAKESTYSRKGSEKLVWISVVDIYLFISFGLIHYIVRIAI